MKESEKKIPKKTLFRFLFRKQGLKLTVCSCLGGTSKKTSSKYVPSFVPPAMAAAFGKDDRKTKPEVTTQLATCLLRLSASRTGDTYTLWRSLLECCGLRVQMSTTNVTSSYSNLFCWPILTVIFSFKASSLDCCLFQSQGPQEH